MRRADRLFQIILLLDRGRAVTARELAEALQVSERTIYRDMNDLSASGVPIQGEAGVGYLLRPGYRLSPLMFDEKELAALALGSRMVQSWADPGLGRAAERALLRIEAVLPQRLKGHPASQTLLVPDFHIPARMTAPMETLRACIAQETKAQLHYTRADGTCSERLVWPLGLVFWGESWMLAAWCELRGEFRSFRLDRMEALQPLADTFQSRGLLARYLASVKGTQTPDAPA